MANQFQQTTAKMTEKEMMSFIQSTIMKDPLMAQRIYSNMVNEGEAPLQQPQKYDVASDGNVTGVQVDMSKEIVQPQDQTLFADSNNKYKDDYGTVIINTKMIMGQ
eukprot:GHVR01156880.1.p3 GENE.GHVR01156880.1~~GHVR01156880.1.p3  ORF type:complete len:106 (+),score=26.64 GHVR01156880.1:248-565(+)